MQFTHIRRAALVAALSALTAPAVSAQEQSTEFPTYLSPGLTFTPGISMAGVWDSNVALAAPSGTAASDSLFIFEPFGQLELISPRTQLVAGYKGYVRRYTDIEALNGFDQRGFFSMRRLATRRLAIFASNEYDDVPTTDETELNGVPFTRTGSKSNRFAGGVESRLAKYTDLVVRYENTWVNFDREESFLSNGWINSIAGDLRQRLSERLSVGAEYRIRKADLDQGIQQGVDLGERDIWFQDFGGVLSYAAGPHTKVTVSGGFSLLNDSQPEGDRKGPYFRGDISHDIDRATIGASYEKSFVPSFGFGGSSNNQEVSGFIHMPLSRNRIYLNTSAVWRRSNPLLEEVELALDTIQISNTLGYAVVRWFRLEGYHAFTRQDSRVTGGEINRQRAGVQLVISQPMRIR